MILLPGIDTPEKSPTTEYRQDLSQLLLECPFCSYVAQGNTFFVGGRLFPLLALVIQVTMERPTWQGNAGA